MKKIIETVSKKTSVGISNIYVLLVYRRFVFHDWRSDDFPVSQLDAQVVFMTMSEEDCCTVKNQAEGSSCTCRGMMNPGPTFVEMASKLLSKTFANLDSAGKATSLTAFTCQGESRRHIFYSAKKKLVK